MPRSTTSDSDPFSDSSCDSDESDLDVGPPSPPAAPRPQAARPGLPPMRLPRLPLGGTAQAPESARLRETPPPPSTARGERRPPLQSHENLLARGPARLRLPAKLESPAQQGTPATPGSFPGGVELQVDVLAEGMALAPERLPLLLAKEGPRGQAARAGACLKQEAVETLGLQFPPGCLTLYELRELPDGQAPARGTTRLALGLPETAFTMRDLDKEFKASAAAHERLRTERKQDKASLASLRQEVQALRLEQQQQAGAALAAQAREQALEAEGQRLRAAAERDQQTVAALHAELRALQVQLERARQQQGNAPAETAAAPAPKRGGKLSKAEKRRARAAANGAGSSSAAAAASLQASLPQQQPAATDSAASSSEQEGRETLQQERETLLGQVQELQDKLARSNLMHREAKAALASIQAGVADLGSRTDSISRSLEGSTPEPQQQSAGTAQSAADAHGSQAARPERAASLLRGVLRLAETLGSEEAALLERLLGRLEARV